MKNLFFLILLLSLSVSPAWSQVGDSQGRSGSVYSKFGVGFPVDLSSSTADGMGLFGVSFTESLIPGLPNPAHWGSSNYGTANGGFNLQGLRATDSQNSSGNLLLAANNFQLQLPLIRQELGISASFYPSTRSTFRTLSTGTIPGGPGDEDDVAFETQSSGSGGINNLEVGIGWNINDFLAVGYAASLVFSSIDHEHATVFDSPLHQQVAFALETSGSGMGHRIGTWLSFSDLLRGEDALNIGFSAKLPVTLDARREEQNLLLVTTDSPNLDLIEEGTIRMPLALTGGVTYRTSPVIAFTTEALFERWSDAEYTFNASEEQMFSDRYKLGAGIRYHPFETGSDRVLSQFKYRAGASYDTGHLTIDGREVDTIMFSAGVGIPSISPRSASSFDVSVYYGLRGTESQNLVRESIWGLKLSLNLAELMFNRPKLQ